jgi:hypothetical protein
MVYLLRKYAASKNWMQRTKFSSEFWVMTNLLHSFLMYLFYASTCFEQQVLIIRRAKLY